MPLDLFYTIVQKSKKMTKNSNQGGSCLNPIQGRLFWSSGGRGGGGGTKCPPPSKNPVPLLRIYSSKIFWKLVQN